MRIRVFLLKYDCKDTVTQGDGQAIQKSFSTGKREMTPAAILPDLMVFSERRWGFFCHTSARLLLSRSYCTLNTL